MSARPGRSLGFWPHAPQTANHNHNINLAQFPFRSRSTTPALRNRLLLVSPFSNSIFQTFPLPFGSNSSSCSPQTGIFAPQSAGSPTSSTATVPFIIVMTSRLMINVASHAHNCPEPRTRILTCVSRSLIRLWNPSSTTSSSPMRFVTIFPHKPIRPSEMA